MLPGLQLTNNAVVNQVIVFAALVTALGVIWFFARRFTRVVWAAVNAAPRIADGIETMNDLINGSVLARLDDHDVRLRTLETTAAVTAAAAAAAAASAATTATVAVSSGTADAVKAAIEATTAAAVARDVAAKENGTTSNGGA